MDKLPDEFLDYLKTITAKRPKTVIDHILKYGFITSEQLKDTYGYNHPPRAVRDVREQGVPIETYRVEGSDGRKIAAYKFGDPTRINVSKHQGRTVFTKELKEQLIAEHGCKCFIYMEYLPEKDLQIDHRIPYEVNGDIESQELNPSDFMLLSGSANRAKSWSCENCNNWNTLKDKSICQTCYWAFPEDYAHIAMQEIRRVDLMWKGKEVSVYEKLKSKANSGKNIQDVIKDILRKE